MLQKRKLSFCESFTTSLECFSKVFCFNKLHLQINNRILEMDVLFFIKTRIDLKSDFFTEILKLNFKGREKRQNTDEL